MIDLHPASTRLSALIEDVSDETLKDPTPCSDYSVGDLLDHICGLTVAFGGAARKTDGETANMGPQGNASNPHPDWRASLPRRLDALADAWSDPGAWSGMTRVGGQDLPGEVAGLIAFGELCVHGWDLSRGSGLSFAPDLDGVSQLFALVRETFGSGQDAARGGAFGPAVSVAADAPTFDQILGLLGRDPGWRP